MSIQPAIEVCGLEKRYRQRVALDGVSFRIMPGRVAALLGPNGAGKSTLMRILVGLVRPDRGSALIGGRAFADWPNPGTRVGVHMDDFGFEQSMSARRQVEIASLATGAPSQRADEVLEAVGLAADSRRRVKEYSQGMAQRLGLAVALVGAPDVLVLDEPTNGLDPQGQRWLRSFLRDFADRGGTALVSSHQLGEVEKIADDVVVLQQRVLCSGSLGDVTQGGTVSLEDRYAGLVDGPTW